MACIPNSAQAGWDKIYQDPYSKHAFRAGCFLDEGFGVIGGEGADGTFRTTDGGSTWTNAPLPGREPGDITQIRMQDRLHGWLTLESDSTKVSLYETTDGALTWQQHSLIGSATDLFVTPTALIVTNRHINGFGAISLNGGSTFSQNQIALSNGVDFVDNTHGVIVGYHTQHWYRTTDGGVTWRYTSTPDTSETWSVFGAKGTATFYTAGENDYSNQGPPIHLPTSIRRSTDYGDTWNKVSTLPIRTTGHITGSGNFLYVQADTNVINKGLTGFYRSSDQGRTWIPIGGPSNVQDTRFIVLGCRGNVVIGFDAHGGVYRTDDGGDGSLAPFIIPQSSVRIDSINVCESKDTVVTIQNTGCDTMYVTGASVPPTPPTSVLDASGGPANFPYVIPPGGRQTLRIRLSSTQVGSFTSSVTLSLLRAGRSRDTTLGIQSTGKASIQLLNIAKVAFDTVSICATRDTTVSLTNPYCAAIQIVDVRMQSGLGFALINPTKNDSIVPGATWTQTIRFSPTQTGLFTDFVLVHITLFGKDTTVRIPIVATAKPDNPQFVLSLGSQPMLDFDTLTRCDQPVKKGFTVTNPGCTGIAVSASMLDSNKAPILVSGVYRWKLTGNNSLTVGDSIYDSLMVIPSKIGLFKGYVHVVYSMPGSGSKDVYIPYQVYVKRGSTVLSVDPSPRDFDTLLFCEQKDLAIPVTNTGCDTLTLTSRQLAGSGFVLLNPITTPFALAPGRTDSIRVRYLPNTTGGATGSVKITSDADGVHDQIIPISGFALPTDTIALRAFTNNMTVRAGDTADIVIIPNRSIRNKGLNSIQINLQYNGDVLTALTSTAATDIPGARLFQPISEVRSGLKTTYLTITVLGNNMSLDSDVAIVHLKFFVTLSDSNSTDFSIQRFVLNNGDLNYGKCALGGVTDTGSIGLQFLCGDAVIYRFMQGGSNFSIEQGIAPAAQPVYPNPVHERMPIVLPYRATRPAAVLLRIYSSSGDLVCTAHDRVTTAGLQQFRLQSPELVSGVYHYTITTEDGGQGILRGEVVVEK